MGPKGLEEMPFLRIDTGVSVFEAGLERPEVPAVDAVRAVPGTGLWLDRPEEMLVTDVISDAVEVEVLAWQTSRVAVELSSCLTGGS